MSLAASWAVTGWAYLLGIALEPKTSQLGAVCLILIFLVTCGVTPTLRKFTDDGKGSLGGSPVYFLSWFSFARWLTEDMFVR